MVVVLVVVGAGTFAAMNPGVVKAFYEDIYPSDPAKRQALELCFMQDHKFNRLESSERDRCYRQMLFTASEHSAPTAVSAEQQPNVNLIDLGRAAAQGNLPRNDIRRLEQNENPPRPPR
jgi:hypothetical protein